MMQRFDESNYRDRFVGPTSGGFTPQQPDRGELVAIPKHEYERLRNMAINENWLKWMSYGFLGIVAFGLLIGMFSPKSAPTPPAPQPQPIVVVPPAPPAKTSKCLVLCFGD